MAQQTEMTSVSKIKYLLYVPDMKAPVAGFPLLLFLHGSGERGDDLELVKKHGPPSFLDDTTNFQFMVISPQCPEGETWSPPRLAGLIRELTSIAMVDKSRIYVSGLSMGGQGTWDFAMAYPNTVAAIAPICGKGDPTQACVLKDIPIWVFHGAKDEVVPNSFSDEMVEALNDCDAYVKYTLYPDVDHFSWVPAYKDPALYEWLLQQKKRND